MQTKTKFQALPSEVRADRRRMALKKLDDGWNKKEAADLAEVHYKTVETWIRNRKFLENNDFREHKRGREKEEQKILAETQQVDILNAIKNSTPDKEGVEYFLWSRKAIREFIEKKYDKTLSFQTISDYTKRWGLSSQRPKKQAAEQDKEKVRLWLEDEYPKIQERAKKEGAEIHWADETNINLNTNYQKTYAPKGNTPVARIPAKKQSFSLVSSVTNQGKMRYMVYKGGMNISLFLKFLKRLSRDTDKKILVILDNLKVHHGKKVQEWAKRNENKIILFFPAAVFSARKS
ncbi:MAG: IS630 family transposase [Candidatus Moranbacteria bacterium CG_4_9_14_3_um_filter_40_7]|nr:MAG: IS630 family transposase [Candidatus Moranbacteria bacterium CG_4_9_14_3_um_filter_40_7]